MPEWMRDVAWVFSGLLFPVALWIVRLLLEIRDGQRETRQFLWGVDGKNGLNSRVRKLEEYREDHEGRLLRLETHEETA